MPRAGVFRLPAPSRAAQIGLAAALALVLATARLKGVTEQFQLLGDQIRDWRVALGSFGDLPLTGPPSSIGGTAAGPAFYWLLWVIRHVIGPFTSNLPHAGGIGLALVQSIADGVLFIAIWRRLQSGLLALAVVLIAATNPFDMALSAVIWNPPASVAFVKFSMAVVLLGGDQPSAWRAAAAFALAWLGVHAHSSALFVAAPVAAAFVGRELWARRWRQGGGMARLLVETLVVLQIPLLIDTLRHPSVSHSPAGVVNSVTYAFAHPGSVNVVSSVDMLSNATGAVMDLPWTAGVIGLAIVAILAAAAFAARRDLAVLSISVIPVACFILGFATWQRPFESHWVLPVMPSLALAIGLAASLIRWPSAPQAGAAALLAAVLASLPWRLPSAWAQFRMPEYGRIVRASREILKRTPEIREIRAEMDLQPSAQPDAIYKFLGGRVTPAAPFAATIGANGEVTYRQK